MAPEASGSDGLPSGICLVSAQGRFSRSTVGSDAFVGAMLLVGRSMSAAGMRRGSKLFW